MQEFEVYHHWVHSRTELVPSIRLSDKVTMAAPSIAYNKGSSTFKMKDVRVLVIHAGFGDATLVEVTVEDPAGKQYIIYFVVTTVC